MSQTMENLDFDKAAEENVKKSREFLREIAGGRVTIESPFEWRTDDGHRIALPIKPVKMDLRRAGNMLLEQADAEEAEHEFTKDFNCRPMDGAFAFSRALKDAFGMSAIGKEQRGFFGGQLPELKTVKVSPTEEVQVPWGALSFPPLGATFHLIERLDDDYGLALQIYVHCKKKYEVEVRGLLMMVETYVRESSIYRNKALIGVGRITAGGYKEPEFFNPYTVAREKVVYSTEVYDALVDEVWGIIQTTELLRENGNEIGNKVLLHGENGTGKTLAANCTAQYCLENGWSFIQARWDEDLHHVLRFAELLGTPSVLVVEDVEKLINNDPQKMDSLLEQFDGMRTKGREVLLLLTSNHHEDLPKAMTRAGRINRMIYVSDLDREGVERLINVLIPAEQREELDYQALHDAYEGFAPSWIVQALNGVSKHSVIRTKKLGQPLATDDFVRAANALRAAHKLHIETNDRPEKPVMDTVIKDIVADVLKSSVVDLEDGEIVVNA